MMMFNLEKSWDGTHVTLNSCLFLTAILSTVKSKLQYELQLINLCARLDRYIIMRRLFTILALLYLMRSITMYVTVLPMSSTTYYCSPKSNTTDTVVVLTRAWHIMTGLGLSVNGKHTYCGDFIYSGHTVMLCMAYLTIAECEYTAVGLGERGFSTVVRRYRCV
jgi:hypothetical protein